MPRFPLRFHSALFLALPLSALSLAARAEEVSVALPDLTYLPGEGRFVSDTTLSYERSRSADYQPGFQLFQSGPNSYLVDKYRENTYLATETLRFGLADGLVVGAAETCREVEQRTHEEQPPFGFDFTLAQNDGGCGNPEFSVTWRPVRQSDFEPFPVNLDIHAGYAPDLLKGDLNHPSGASGGQAGDVELTVSRSFDEMSVLGLVGAQWSGRTRLGDSAGNAQWSKAFARPYAELLVQYKPDGEFFLSAGATAYAGYTVDSRSFYSYAGFVENGQSREKTGAAYEPEMGAAWLAVPDLLSVSLHYSHVFGATAKGYDIPSGLLTNVSQQVSADIVSLDIRFQL